MSDILLKYLLKWQLLNFFNTFIWLLYLTILNSTGTNLDYILIRFEAYASSCHLKNLKKKLASTLLSVYYY